MAIVALVLVGRLESLDTLGLLLTAVGAFVFWKVGSIAQDDLKAATEEHETLISAARERAAAMEKDAADARLETERLKLQVSWRTLTDEQREVIRRVLAASPGRVNVRYLDGDVETRSFVMQLDQLLADAGWEVAYEAVRFEHTLFAGIWLPDNGPDARILRRAFLDAAVPFETAPPPPPSPLTFAPGDEIAGAPRLLIGARAPPNMRAIRR